MMAGEIGASVVVVKEIEVPFGMVELVARRGGEEEREGEGGGWGYGYGGADRD